MSVLPGFAKAQSDNLPKMDAICMFGFLGKNSDFVAAEIRGAKAKRSGRESYGDNAIGYVQLKREANLCTVKARITPEHRISNKSYEVTVVVNEEEEEVISAQCDNCAAALGGCKHVIAFLAWLHRRSEEPSVTQVNCYWKKSKLSGVGKSLKYIKGKNMQNRNIKELPQTSGTFLSAVKDMSKSIGRNDTVLTKYFVDFSAEEQLSLYQLILKFIETKEISANDFIQFCTNNMSEAACREAERKTRKQSDNKLWHDLRFGRITASKAHESAHCHTMNGSLVESFLGASSLKDTDAMKRGKKLEPEVRKQIKKETGIKIQECGFMTSRECPIMGASPDGISDDYVIEIKCPTTEKNTKKYISEGRIHERYRAQIQLQMYFSKKQKGLFCMADPNFEITKQISITLVQYEPDYCTDLIKKCIEFWKAGIFPMLYQK